MSTPRFVRAVPTLATTQLAESVEFYRTQLGFNIVDQDDATAVLARDEIQLLLWACTDPELPRNDGCRVLVTAIDALFATCSAAGIVHPNGALESKPWGLREFTVLDPCGAAVTFFDRASG